MGLVEPIQGCNGRCSQRDCKPNKLVCGHARMLPAFVARKGAADRANAAFSDIYYIPSKLSQEFLEIVYVFLRHKVFLEIGVATTIRCLVAPTNVQPLLGYAPRRCSLGLDQSDPSNGAF